MKSATFLFSVCLLTACAETPKTLYLDPRNTNGNPTVMVWPNAGETPRFSYAGELLGQTNFRVSPDAKESTAVQVLSWLAGLDQGQAQQPVVLQRPQGGAVDADGRIYVSDVSRQAIFVFDPVVGDLHVWEWATESNRFRSPVGIVVRPDGEVLVADSELGQIVRLAPDGRPKGVFASNELQRPTGLALDPASGLLYVADTRANEIKVFTHQGRLQLSFGNPGDGPGQLNAPTYLAVAEDRIYVTDTLNARIQVFDTAGHLQHVIGERGHYIGNLSRPKGIAVSSDGLIYVVESYYDYLLVYDRDGRFLMPIGGPGRKPGEFMLPAGVWLDERGRVYVSDMLNGRVSIFQFLGADT